MHAWVVYHREVLHVPLRTLAAQIGISKSAVDKFHKLRSHPGKNWPKLRDWYMSTRLSRARQEYQTPPALLVDSALLFVSQLPSSKRAFAVRKMVESYHELFAEMKEPLPEWVQLLTQQTEGEGSS